MNSVIIWYSTTFTIMIHICHKIIYISWTLTFSICFYFIPLNKKCFVVHLLSVL